MSGSYCGVRIGFYLLMVVGAVLFFVTQVMASGNASPGLKLEDCDWFRQRNQQVIETDAQARHRPTGDTSEQMGLGGGGAPTYQPGGDEENFWEIAAISGECPARNAN
ncbi:MAG: hypothetical protein IH870_07295 [Chloroflexi bacterium]|nr:hypothetical protein [Chloroflexota bacterium]